MKYFAVVPLAMMISMPCFSADHSNPFVSPLPPPAIDSASPAAPALEDPLPKSFSENRSVFDMMEVVGRGANSAILRIPMTSGQSNMGAPVGAATTAQGMSYRQLVVKSGRDIFVGGRLYKVALPKDGTSVVLADSKGRIAWEGDLQGAKVFNVSPNISDYQYSPPLSAGNGIGQTTGAAGAVSASASGQSANQPAQGQGGQPGMTR